MVMFAAVEFALCRICEVDDGEFKEGSFVNSGSEGAVVLVKTVDEADLISVRGVVVLERLEASVELSPRKEEESR